MADMVEPVSEKPDIVKGRGTGRRIDEEQARGLPSGPGQNAHQQAGYMFAVEPNLHLRHLAKPGTFIHGR